MKQFFTINLLLSMLWSYSQGTKIRVFRNADELKTAVTDTLFGINIRHSILNETITVTKLDSSKVEFPFNKIWGFKDKEGKIYRNNKLNFVQLEGETNGLCLYSKSYGKEGSYGWWDIKMANGVGTFGQNYSSRSETFFFSKTLGGEIFKFKKSNIDNEYRNTPCFPQRLKQIKTAGSSYSFIVSSITPRKMIEIYTKCQESQHK
jgi:hypothetical protein